MSFFDQPSERQWSRGHVNVDGRWVEESAADRDEIIDAMREHNSGRGAVLIGSFILSAAIVVAVAYFVGRMLP